MPETTGALYLICFAVAWGLSLGLTPLMRLLALRWGILDHPHSEVKTHVHPTPYLGGVAVAAAFAAALTITRFLTDFPTGTLHALRGLFAGGALILLLGLVDDIKPKGLHYKEKFWVQLAAAVCLLLFDIRIRFIQPEWFADMLTILWVVGVINAVNIIDVMDGLAGGIACIAAFGFLFISLPSESIYVNFAAAALAGALLGFLPFNLSKKRKIFMGDAGSLLVGFILAALSLGTSYTRVNPLGVFAPLLILGLPLYDTFLVIFLRTRRGQSPFLGSRDHFALRLESYGFFREEILVLSYAMSFFLTFIAYEVTVVSTPYAVLIYAGAGILSLWVGRWLARIPID